MGVKILFHIKMWSYYPVGDHSTLFYLKFTLGRKGQCLKLS